ATHSPPWLARFHHSPFLSTSAAPQPLISQSSTWSLPSYRGTTHLSSTQPSHARQPFRSRSSEQPHRSSDHALSDSRWAPGKRWQPYPPARRSHSGGVVSPDLPPADTPYTHAVNSDLIAWPPPTLYPPVDGSTTSLPHGPAHIQSQTGQERRKRKLSDKENEWIDRPVKRARTAAEFDAIGLDPLPPSTLSHTSAPELFLDFSRSEYGMPSTHTHTVSRTSYPSLATTMTGPLDPDVSSIDNPATIGQRDSTYIDTTGVMGDPPMTLEDWFNAIDPDPSHSGFLSATTNLDGLSIPSDLLLATTNPEVCSVPSDFQAAATFMSPPPSTQLLVSPTPLPSHLRPGHARANPTQAPPAEVVWDSMLEPYPGAYARVASSTQRTSTGEAQDPSPTPPRLSPHSRAPTRTNPARESTSRTKRQPNPPSTSASTRARARRKAARTSARSPPTGQRARGKDPTAKPEKTPTGEPAATPIRAACPVPGCTQTFTRRTDCERHALADHLRGVRLTCGAPQHGGETTSYVPRYDTLRSKHWRSGTRDARRTHTGGRTPACLQGAEYERMRGALARALGVAYDSDEAQKAVEAAYGRMSLPCWHSDDYAARSKGLANQHRKQRIRNAPGFNLVLSSVRLVQQPGL
ncbi:hypothetical protein BD413DRAFT_627306, partial [Trametes elegans]